MYDDVTLGLTDVQFTCYIFCTWSLQRGSKKSKRDDADDFDMADVSDIQPRARSGRAASKPVKYHFDTDDDDDDDDEWFIWWHYCTELLLRSRVALVILFSGWCAFLVFNDT